MDKKPKILVCSVNSWNSKVGDNTFSILLKGHPKEKIAVVFIREDSPDSDECMNYFRISEGAVIKSIVKPKAKTGRKVYVNEIAERKKTSRIVNLYKHKNKGSYYLKLGIREVLWYLGRWKSKELNEFIDSFKPDIVIYEMSRYIHLNRIIEYILQRTGAKGVGCFWDDTFTYKQEKSMGYKLLRFFQRRSLKSLSQYTTDYFAITPKTKKEADAFLGINSVVLTKPVMSDGAFTEKATSSPIRLLYTGNLGIGRLDTLRIIVNVISKDQDFILDIYTNSYLSDAERRLLKSENTYLHNAVSQTEVLELQRNADVLLFLEDISEDNRMARLSFSTKITDYYAAGKCIFAVGNKDLAPMELLKESNSALIANNAAEVVTCINQLKDKEVIHFFAKRSYIVGREQHSILKIKKTFWDVLLR